MEMEEEYVCQMEQLQEENLALRKHICALEHILANGTPMVDGVADSVLATVIYHDIKSEKRNKLERFVESLQDCINDSEIDIEDSDGEEEETYHPNSMIMSSGVCSDHLNCSCESRVMKLTGAVEYHNHFMLDRLGSPMIVRQDSFILPDDQRLIYDQIYFQPYWAPNQPKNGGIFKIKKFTIKCFNCGEDHHINACPKPFNPFNVARNRIQFQEESGVGPNKRYYLEVESQERFNKFEPGKISDKLRKALSLQDNELPIYITRMKHHGYPPGWRLLKEETLKIFTEGVEETSTMMDYEDIVYPGYNDKTVVAKFAHEDSLTLLGPSNESNDLGELEDYEFDMEEEGGFVLRKLVRDESVVEDSEESPCSLPTRSLDFPPGLVEIEHPSVPPKRRWTDLVRLIEKRKDNKMLLGGQ